MHAIPRRPPLNTQPDATVRAPSPWISHLSAVLLCVLATVLAWPLAQWLDPANIVMLYLLVVVIAAVRFGRHPAMVAAFLSVALFDFFFVAPQFSFAVNDAQYLVTFAVMLVVALTIGQLANALKARADDAQTRADEQTRLHGLAQALAGTLSVQHAARMVSEFVAQQLSARVVLLVPDKNDNFSADCAQPRVDDQTFELSNIERTAATAVYTSSATLDATELGHDDGERLLLPLLGATRRRGVMIVAATVEAGKSLRANKSLLRAVASLFTTALERLHYVDVANQTELSMHSERLRNSILAAISHDIRTPLTALYGLADTLASDPAISDPQTRETASSLRDQAMQLNTMVTNLLDMARMQAGLVTLRREWQPLDEVIGASIHFVTPTLKGRHVTVSIDADLPLVNIDAVLMERVLCNLIENAAKFSPDASNVHIRAVAIAQEISVSISNAGSGFPVDQLDAVFTLFARGEQDGHSSGMGVGLAICRAIVEVHGGRIAASNPDTGGACVTFTLPRGDPPEIVLDAEPNITLTATQT